ncbi:MAG: hypothetical protein ABJG78_03280 [Cyclobacteriaceae bacterium]
MTTSYRIFHLILKLTIAATLFALTSCEREYNEPYENFTLPEGKHDKGIKAQSLQSSTLRFEAIFDQSAIYQTQIVENQHDINKLLGFSDCNSFHHGNSARLGWRWLDGQLEIHAYAYVNGERIIEFVGTVALDMSNSYQIKMTDDAYIFYLEGFDPVEIKRGNHCDKGLYYMLFPYFGGDEVAPHDILIQIRIDY